ncbi:uncharacterized protein [Antennarius striatus]|uniref:uncharacterized protein isoform X2 n=1 Tax=Antennarius striatus TaxID=241820 RepID=UPI0035B4833F
MSRHLGDDSLRFQGCVSSASESGTIQRILPLTHKPAGRHGSFSLFFDPYDGSSEDSDGSNINISVFHRRTQQQGRGGCRCSSRNRRFVFHQPTSLREEVKNEGEQQPLLDVQMKCGSDSELWMCKVGAPPSHSERKECRDINEKMAWDSIKPAETMDIELDCKLDDTSGHASRSSKPPTNGPVIPMEGSVSQMVGSSSERSPSPCILGSLYKRKFCFPGAEVGDMGQRKRQCVINMQDEQEGGSAYELLQKN